MKQKYKKKNLTYKLQGPLWKKNHPYIFDTKSFMIYEINTSRETYLKAAK